MEQLEESAERETIDVPIFPLECLTSDPHVNDSWDQDAFTQILGEVGLIRSTPAPASSERRAQSERPASRDNDDDNSNEAACAHEIDAAARGRYRCLVGHGESCALVGGTSSCCPPPALEDEELWVLVGDKVGGIL